MSITYKLTNDPITDKEADTILRTDTDDVSGEVSWIPKSEDNVDYQKYLAWVAEGNTAEPADVIDVWIKIREERDRLLTKSDWTQANNTALTSAKVTEWATYRTKLRTLPVDQSSKTSYEDITWPSQPS
jgi:hypothetical protein